MSSQQIDTKVCIIGAGFAGLTLANILQKHDIPYILIEKHSESGVCDRQDIALIDSQTENILSKNNLSDRLLQEGIVQSQCEFRTPEQNFILNYAEKCRHQTNYLYPQQKLLVDLIGKLQYKGGEILFSTQAVEIDNHSDGATVKCQQNGKPLSINCEFVAGCDGTRGIARASIPQSSLKLRYKNFDYSWLNIRVRGNPSHQNTVYATHPAGFAGYTIESENVFHYYLQIPKKDTASQWSHERIWSELKLRLGKDETFAKGEIVEVQVLEIGSYSTQTMQDNRLFLAGSSAHLVNPVSGKGLNLAIQDANILGQAFISYYCSHQNLALKNYSTSRLPAVRKMQQFSASLLQMINTHDDSTPEGKSIQRLQKFKRSQLMYSEIYALDFARNYVGYLTTEKSAVRSNSEQALAKAS